MKRTVQDVMNECKSDAAQKEPVSSYGVAARMVDIGIIYRMSVTDFFCALDNAKVMAMKNSRMEKEV